jgi:hypothetical protein
MSFDQERRYYSTVEAYESVAQFSGPHHYGNKKKMIFVWCEKEMSKNDGEKVRLIVEKL